MPIIQSISGLRATLDEINPELIKKYAIAYSNFINHYNINSLNKIIIGRDGRPSGVWIEEILVKELANLGWNIEIIGIVPTPTVQLIVEQSHAAGGIAITASHNPSNWNGLKFLNSKGIFLDKNENEIFSNFLAEKLENFTEKSEINTNKIGKVAIKNDAIDKHIDKILSIPFVKNELKNIKSKNFNIVVDAVNAAGSVAVVKLLEKLNCKIHKLFCDESGNFPHNPEPLPENLTEISSFIKNNSDENFIGIAVDPDADRLVLIGENGDCIGEEKTICIAIDSYFSLNENDLTNKFDKIVVNQSTTFLADIVAKKYSKKIIRSAVGEINVVKKMIENNSLIGGEGSGGVILAECHFGRDSLVGIVLMLAILAKKNSTLQNFVTFYPKFEMVKYKQEFSGKKEKLYEKILNYYSKNDNSNSPEISLIDGIKITYEDSWLHLRTSNTEPIIRIISEAPTKNQAQKMIDEIIFLIK
jgi:phosphomannomutase